VRVFLRGMIEPCLNYHDGGLCIVDNSGGSGPPPSYWSEVAIRPGECMRQWPGQSAPKLDPTHGRPTDAELVQWYRLRVANHDPQQLPPSRDDDVEAAEKHFQTEGIVKRVYAVRADEAPPEWTRSGSKGKKRALAQSGQK
jgi:hypothetical protein